MKKIFLVVFLLVGAIYNFVASYRDEVRVAQLNVADVEAYGQNEDYEQALKNRMTKLYPGCEKYWDDDLIQLNFYEYGTFLPIHMGIGKNYMKYTVIQECSLEFSANVISSSGKITRKLKKCGFGEGQCYTSEVCSSGR